MQVILYNSYLCLSYSKTIHTMVIEEMNSLTKDEDFDELKNKYQEITSVLAAHQIALWEYDIPTGQCSFTDDYFRILGLREAASYLKILMTFINMPIRKISCLTGMLFHRCLNRRTRYLRYRCAVWGVMVKLSGWRSFSLIRRMKRDTPKR